MPEPTPTGQSMQHLVRREFALAPVLIHRLGSRDRTRVAALAGYIERLLRLVHTGAVAGGQSAQVRLLIARTRPALARWRTDPSARTAADLAHLLGALDTALGEPGGALADEELEALPRLPEYCTG